MAHKLRRQARKMVDAQQQYPAQAQVIQQQIGQSQADLGDQTSSLNSLGAALTTDLRNSRQEVRANPNIQGRDQRIALAELKSRRRDIKGGVQLAVTQAGLDAAKDQKSLQEGLVDLGIRREGDIQSKLASLRKDAQPSQTQLTLQADIDAAGRRAYAAATGHQPSEAPDPRLKVSIAQAQRNYQKAVQNGIAPSTQKEWEDFVAGTAADLGVVLPQWAKKQRGGTARANARIFAGQIRTPLNGPLFRGK